MGKLYLPVYKAGDNEFVITSYEAVFKTEQMAIDESESLLMMEDIRAPATFERVLSVDKDEGIEGVTGNFTFLNVMYISGDIFESRDYEDKVE